MRALVFGEILWDIIHGTSHLGGAPFNFAAHLAKMGGEVTVLSAVGDDELGSRAIEKAKEYRIDTRFIGIHSDLPTGTVDVTVDASGQPDYTIHENVAWDSIELSEEEYRALETPVWDVIYIGTIAQRSDMNRAVLRRLFDTARRNHVFCDVNLRQSYYSRDIIERSLLVSTVVKVNDDEARTLSELFNGRPMPIEPAARRLRESFGHDIVIVTRGGEGAFVCAENESLYTTCSDVEVIDTVGAGDSFSAGFLYGFLSGMGISVASNLAASVADFVVSRAGAIPDYPEGLETRFA